jgi:integrase
MPKQRRRKCSEPRCCWHRGSKGRTSEGEGLGGERPVPQNKRCLEDAVPEKPKKIGSRDPAEAKVSVRRSTSAFVFTSERGGAPFTRDSFNWMVKRAGKKAGLPFQVHAHMIRHATGYKLANASL